MNSQWAALTDDERFAIMKQEDQEYKEKTKMGDHRATIKISLTFPNRVKPYEMDAWMINYWPDDDGVDIRVVEFFQKAWDEYQDWYQERNRPTPPPVCPHCGKP